MRFEIKELEGKDHYVVPVVMAVEGVLNGSHGALLYPADELKKSTHLWNGRPVVVYHPDMYSNGIAGNPDVFNRQKVGTIFHTRYEKKALKAEAWLDIERLEKTNKRIVQAVQNGELMEVSTGLFLEHDDYTGTFNGKTYIGKAKNFRPDHLAILPDQIGACSIEDGAGLCRNLGQNEELLVLPQFRF
jgi:hypothetical protein